MVSDKPGKKWRENSLIQAVGREGMTWHRIYARYRGTCRVCKKIVYPGTLINWSDSTSYVKHAYHMEEEKKKNRVVNLVFEPSGKNCNTPGTALSELEDDEEFQKRKDEREAMR